MPDLANLNVNSFGHLAYLLILCSFMVKQIAVLRVFSISASCFSIIYNYYSSSQPLWVPIQWNILFLSVNAYHLVMLALSKRGISLDETLSFMHSKHFLNITQVEFVRLLKIGFKRTYSKGHVLINQDENPDAIFLILSGQATVSINGNIVATLKKGEFVGEMGFLTGQKTKANVQFSEKTVVQYWDNVDLKKFLMSNPKFLASFHSAIGNQLITKLIDSSLKQSESDNVSKVA